MMREVFMQEMEQSRGCSRRRFLGGAVSVAASAPLMRAAAGLAANASPETVKPEKIGRKIRLGCCGLRRSRKLDRQVVSAAWRI